MSVPIAPDRKEESTDNTYGAPDIAAQQMREHQAAAKSSQSGQHHAGAVSGQEKQSDWTNTSNQQIDAQKTEGDQKK